MGRIVIEIPEDTVNAVRELCAAGKPTASSHEMNLAMTFLVRDCAILLGDFPLLIGINAKEIDEILEEVMALSGIQGDEEFLDLVKQAERQQFLNSHQQALDVVKCLAVLLQPIADDIMPDLVNNHLHHH